MVTTRLSDTSDMRVLRSIRKNALLVLLCISIPIVA